MRLLDVKNRRAVVLQSASKLKCDCVAAFEPENVFYLTGFWGEAIALCSDDSTKLIAPKLEYDRAIKCSKDCEVISTERGSELISSFISALGARKAGTDCIDRDTINAVQQQGGRLILDSQPFLYARRFKDESEIRIISRAARILDKLYEVCEEEIKPGVSERELQAKLVFEGMKLGANPPSYKSTLNPLIIASGANAALPHAEVSNRKFRRGEFIIADLTLRHQGYIADATRTFAIGTLSKEMSEVYALVKESQIAGLKAAKSGNSCGTVDRACRTVIEQRGYGKQFIHSTGHGIGLDVHEPPWIRANNDEILSNGMAITVEPGVYIKNKFGVRIEDSIVISNGRPHVLNGYTKDLLILD